MSAFKITVQEIKCSSLTAPKDPQDFKEIYSQTVENLDLPTVILAVNKGGVTETIKDWFKKLTETTATKK